jgi:type III restriction enzyme
VRVELKDFQEEKLGELLRQADLACAELQAGGDPQALVLASPTGSGKTLIATTFMEQLVLGSNGRPPDPEATFLWLSYQPDLNEQTRRKI